LPEYVSNGSAATGEAISTDAIINIFARFLMSVLLFSVSIPTAAGGDRRLSPPIRMHM
jgi:hypothetical protein